MEEPPCVPVVEALHGADSAGHDSFFPLKLLHLLKFGNVLEVREFHVFYEVKLMACGFPAEERRLFVALGPIQPFRNDLLFRLILLHVLQFVLLLL